MPLSYRCWTNTPLPPSCCVPMAASWRCAGWMWGVAGAVGINRARGGSGEVGGMGHFVPGGCMMSSASEAPDLPWPYPMLLVFCRTCAATPGERSATMGRQRSWSWSRGSRHRRAPAQKVEIGLPPSLRSQEGRSRDAHSLALLVGRRSRADLPPWPTRPTPSPPCAHCSEGNAGAVAGTGDERSLNQVEQDAGGCCDAGRQRRCLLVLKLLIPTSHTAHPHLNPSFPTLPYSFSLPQPDGRRQ